MTLTLTTRGLDREKQFANSALPLIGTDRGRPINHFRIGGKKYQPGSELEGLHEPDFRLKVVGRLGGGAYGESHLIVDRLTGKHYTLKKYKDDIRAHVKAAIQNAIAIHAEIGKEIPQGAMQTHVRGNFGSEPILFTFEEGDNLGTVIEELDQASFDEVIAISREKLEQILKNIAHLHERSVIHRDIKPNNITENGALLDTDLMIRAGQQDGITMGHQWFNAPEVQGGNNFSFQSDLYGVGATIATALMGREPFSLFEEEVNFQKRLEMSTRGYGDERRNKPSKRMQFRANYCRHIERNGLSSLDAWKHLHNGMKDRSDAGALVRTIDKMLQKDPSQRPETTNECLEMLYTQ